MLYTRQIVSMYARGHLSSSFIAKNYVIDRKERRCVLKYVENPTANRIGT